ncbi:MAG TPA: methylmalonyl Co-A mutase-associated GTPase MeaB [Longimicrobiales bacterium]|nr:methylmalonyl Co-A mutase-associated GTPase MeaB [Longimicrobiales bacterium]
MSVVPESRAAPDHRDLLERFAAGHRPALARVISIVENGRPGFEALLDTLHPRLGRAHRIGVTGPPGAGKSTLTTALVQLYRRQGLRVAVVAVDPTSPFTGGALLGDRIRMNDVALDEGVFIRSMATRGALGGLALTTREVADVMDAFGFDRLIIETVGVGQSELDIAAAADTTVVVLVPESGDSVQAMKAGLMEAADLFVINKADRPGADKLAREVSLMIHLRLGQGMRNVPAHHGVRLKAPGTSAPATSGATATTGAAAGATSSAAAEHTPHPQPPAVPPPPRPPSPPPAVNPWEIPVLKTIAETGSGVEELEKTITAHGEWLDRSGERSKRRRQRLAERVREQVARRLQQLAWQQKGARLLEESLPELEEGRATPYAVAARIVRAVSGE